MWVALESLATMNNNVLVPFSNIESNCESVEYVKAQRIVAYKLNALNNLFENIIVSKKKCKLCFTTCERISMIFCPPLYSLLICKIVDIHDQRILKKYETLEVHLLCACKIICSYIVFKTMSHYILILYTFILEAFVEKINGLKRKVKKSLRRSELNREVC